MINGIAPKNITKQSGHANVPAHKDPKTAKILIFLKSSPEPKLVE
jgi:hypothetical protein